MASGIVYGFGPVPFSGVPRRGRHAYHGFGDLSQSDLDACQQALDKLCAAASQAAAASTPSTSQTFTSWLLGAQSTVAAAKADAAATQNLCNVMSAKLSKWQADPTQATHEDAIDFVRTCGQGADVSSLLAGMKLVSAGNLVSTVASDTASDIQAGVESAAGFTFKLIPWWAWVVGIGGLAVYLGWKPLKRS